MVDGAQDFRYKEDKEFSPSVYEVSAIRHERSRPKSRPRGIGRVDHAADYAEVPVGAMFATSPPAYGCSDLQLPLIGMCGEPASRRSRGRTASQLSRSSQAGAVSVNPTYPIVSPADRAQQVLVSLRIAWPSWTASERAGHARRQCGRAGRAAVIRKASLARHERRQDGPRQAVRLAVGA